VSGSWREQRDDAAGRLGQQRLLLTWVGANDQVVAAHTDGHVALQQHRQTAEHRLLGEPWIRTDQLAYSSRETLVVGHARIVTQAGARSVEGGAGSAGLRAGIAGERRILDHVAMCSARCDVMVFEPRGAGDADGCAAV
jgi:hypothetical protein